MWQYFIPFSKGLLEGKDPLEAGKDAVVSGTLNNVAGQFSSALDTTAATDALPYTGPVADAGSYASHLTNSTGIPVSSAVNTANTAIMPSYMDTTGQMLNKGFDITSVPFSPETVKTSPFSTTADVGYAPDYMRTMKTPIQEEVLPPLSARTDVAQTGPFDIGPDMSQVVKPEAQDLAKAGGYEETPLYKRAYDKVAKYIEDKPLEASLTAATLGGAIYEGVKPKQTPITTAPLGPQLGGKQYSGGGDQLLKVRRPR
jgi:hypothetical protein